MNIGILTHYYDSYNYGGLLQSYALPTAINAQFHHVVAQQIPCRYRLKPRTKLGRLLRYTNPGVWTDKFQRMKQQASGEDSFFLRKQGLASFRANIPHLEGGCWDAKRDWNRLNERFDGFIVGSDQVWNPHWFYAPFYLTFAQPSPLKIAYGASLGVSQWTRAQKKAVLPLIERFDHVSVREQTGQQMLSRATSKPISLVCDPVWLLDVATWNAIAQPPLPPKTYVYGYLLGGDAQNRHLATQVAQQLQLPLVTSPYLHLKPNGYDATFGQIHQPHATPEQFLGLVGESQFVVTDSYHGVLFALLYQRPFVALLRHQAKEKAGMNTRITDLLAEFHLDHRVITKPAQLTPAFFTQAIDFSAVEEQIQEKRRQGFAFLAHALEVAP